MDIIENAVIVRKESSLQKSLDVIPLNKYAPISIRVIEHIYADGIGGTYISIIGGAFNTKLKDNK